MQAIEPEIMEWTGCYSGNWRGLITPESFSHPAKFAPNLIRRIFQHGIERGYWKAGDVIGDCFGGIGGGGVIAPAFGLRWIGVELEPKFHALALANFDLHRAAWRACGKPEPTILQGDSREFAQLVGGVAGCVTSPPFGEDQPCASQTRMKKDYHAFTRGDGTKRDHEMRSAGNIAALRPGDLAAVVTSPPYADSVTSDDKYESRMRRLDTCPPSDLSSRTLRELDNWKRNGIPDSGQWSQEHYGSAPGQIGRLAAGDLDAVVTNRLTPHTEYGYPSFNVSKEALPCQNVKTAEPKSQEEADGAGSVSDSTSEGRESRRLKNTKQKSQQPIMGFQTRFISRRTTETGKAETIGGEDTLGEFADGMPFDETKTSAAIAGPCPHSSSTTSEILPKPEGLGTTDLKTYERYVEDATTITGSPASTIPSARRVGSRTPLGPQSMGPVLPHVGQNSTRQNITDGKVSIDPDNYWKAMCLVYAECFKALRPGGVLACVIKDYVKDKARVPLCDQTHTLLLHCGFEPIERARAMLTETTEEDGLFGTVTSKKERKSFFRRLCESKGSPRIDWEEVLFVRRPT